MRKKTYRISGASRDSGIDLVLLLRAESRQSAEQQANKAGVLVSGVSRDKMIRVEVAILVAIVSALLGVAISPKRQAISKPASPMEAPFVAVERLPGDLPETAVPIETQVDTVTAPKDVASRPGELDAWPTAEYWNMGFHDCEVRIERDEGEVWICFDYNAVDFKDTQENNYREFGLGPQPLLVRLFDKNGQHLTHFETAEGYFPAGMSSGWTLHWFEEARRRGKPLPKVLKLFDNRLVYRVNVRDANFIQRAEVGWSVNPAASAIVLTQNKWRFTRRSEPK